MGPLDKHLGGLCVSSMQRPQLQGGEVEEGADLLPWGIP